MRYALALLVVCLCGPLRADIVIGNYPPTNDGNAQLLAAEDASGAVAGGFSMPAGLSYTLDSVTLRLRVSDPGRTIGVQLFGDVGGNPGGASLLSFTVPDFTTQGTADYTMLPATPFTLLESTTYWLTAFGVGSGGIDAIFWMGSSPNVTPTGIATSAGYRNGGANALPPTTNSNIFTTYRIEGTAIAGVPEPSSWILGCLGSVCFGVMALRRRKATQPG